MSKLGTLIDSVRRQLREMGELPSEAEAREIGDLLGVNWEKIPISEFRLGLAVELEHGSASPATNVTHDDKVVTGKIALAHLNELPDYYTRLQAVEPGIAKLRAQLPKPTKEEIRRRIKANVKRTREARESQYTSGRSGPAPRYDEVFFRGVRWLNKL